DAASTHRHGLAHQRAADTQRASTASPRHDEGRVDLRDGAASALHNVANTAAGFRRRPSSLRQAVDRLFGGRGWKGGGKTRGQRKANGSSVSSPETTSTKPNLFATSCRRLPQNLHGEEGVDGSRPSEGSAKAAQGAAFSGRGNLHEFQYAVGMELGTEPFMEPQGREGYGRVAFKG